MCAGRCAVFSRLPSAPAARQGGGKQGDAAGRQQAEYQLAKTGVADPEVHAGAQEHRDHHGRRHDGQQRQHAGLDDPAADVAGEGDHLQRQVEVLDDGALPVLVEAAHRAPERRHHAGEAAQAAHHTAGDTRQRIARAAASHARQPRREEHQRADDHQHHPEHQLEERDVQSRQQPQAQGQSREAAGHEGQQRAPVPAAPHRDSGQHLAGERTDDAERGGKLGVERPGPQGHGGQAETETGETLDEAGEGGAEGDGEDEGHAVAVREFMSPGCPWMSLDVLGCHCGLDPQSTTAPASAPHGSRVKPGMTSNSPG
jgi:hypothetical protein